MMRLIKVNGAQSTIASAQPKRDLVGDVSMPDAVLPEQYFDRAATAVPERRLMFAILLDAIMHLERRGTAGADEAKRWISRVTDGPCSFRSICDAVGIEPTHLARRLLAWYAGGGPHLLGPARRLRTTVQRRMILRRTSGPTMPSSSAPTESSRRLVLNQA